MATQATYYDNNGKEFKTGNCFNKRAKEFFTCEFGGTSYSLMRLGTFGVVEGPGNCWVGKEYSDEQLEVFGSMPEKFKAGWAKGRRNQIRKIMSAMTPSHPLYVEVAKAAERELATFKGV